MTPLNSFDKLVNKQWMEVQYSLRVSSVFGLHQLLMEIFGSLATKCRTDKQWADTLKPCKVEWSCRFDWKFSAITPLASDPFHIVKSFSCCNLIHCYSTKYWLQPLQLCWTFQRLEHEKLHFSDTNVTPLYICLNYFSVEQQ